MKKNLLDYDFPQDLKNMSNDELELLSYSIREFLIEKVSKTGGHVASNLGIVELTLALHKVFDSPKDKIIWDVGHQSYVHKILTGRAKDFDTLRTFGGISGFPKAKESEHDVFDTGHSSTSISVAEGMAKARDIRGENNEVIAVIGDGSLTGGMAFEALNNIGASKSKVIVILNDNGMSISKNIGGLSTHLGNLRTSKGYLSAKNFIKNKVGKIPTVGKGIAQGLADFKNDIKYSIIGDNGGVIFEELGFTYFGVIDGHDINALTDVLNKAKSLNEPILIHINTKKGKGYINAEKAPRKFHGISPFNPETGEILKKSDLPSFSELIGRFAVEKASKDNRICAITAAMGAATGLVEFSLKFPDRFFDVGIAEEHAVTFAGGLAKAGMKPLVCIYSSFLQRGYDQIIEDVCMQNLPVVFCIDRAGVVGQDGETHHGIFDLSYLLTIPNLTILTPRNGNQLKEAMDYAFTLDTPCAIRYPRGNTVYEESADVGVSEIGLGDGDGDNVYDKKIMSIQQLPVATKNERIVSGNDVDIWACGKMYDCAIQVLDILKSKGIKAGIVDVKCIKPLDISAFDNYNDSRLMVTIEDNLLIGGFGQYFNSVLLEKGVKNLNVLNFGWPDKFIEHGTFDELADEYGLTPQKISERICEYLERKA